MNLVGTPSDDLFNKIQSEDARNYIKNLPKLPGQDCAKYFAMASPVAQDLLTRMLDLDPDKR
jgi:p38 MAP kinase